MRLAYPDRGPDTADGGDLLNIEDEQRRSARVELLSGRHADRVAEADVLRRVNVDVDLAVVASVHEAGVLAVHVVRDTRVVGLALIETEVVDERVASEGLVHLPALV